ncbi:MAG: hypothetical protein IJV31_03060 [Clostridia bacterium]|nr:hypothetical protein [Clostridia bacterium]
MQSEQNPEFLNMFLDYSIITLNKSTNEDNQNTERDLAITTLFLLFELSQILRQLNYHLSNAHLMHC